MAAAAVLSPWASKQQLSFSPNATEVFGGRRAGEFPRSRRCRNGKPRTRSLGGLSKPLDNASAQVQPLQRQSHSPISSHRVALGVVKRRTPPPPRPSEDGVKLIKRHRFAVKFCILITFLVTLGPWVCWKHGAINETLQWRCSQTASPSLFLSRSSSPRQTSMHHNPSARSTTTAANGFAREDASGEAGAGIRHPMTVSGEPSVVIRLGIQGRRTGASVVRINNLSQSPT